MYSGDGEALLICLVYWGCEGGQSSDQGGWWCLLSSWINFVPHFCGESKLTSGILKGRVWLTSRSSLLRNSGESRSERTCVWTSLCILYILDYFPQQRRIHNPWNRMATNNAMNTQEAATFWKSLHYKITYTSPINISYDWQMIRLDMFSSIIKVSQIVFPWVFL